MIKLGVSGACGRMGRRIIYFAGKEKDVTVLFGLEVKGCPDVNKKVEGVMIVDDLQAVRTCDCLIDFTAPQATIEHLSCAVDFKKAVVIGTTGLDEGHISKIKEASKHIPIVFSPNMSVGVNLLFKLTGIAASVLKDYGVYIEEAHHVHKKDSPSGTAKKIAQVINEHGFHIRSEEIKAIREGEIIGDHKIVFESDTDKIEISHSAKTRDIFAQGAVVAAKWVVSKKPGLYSMGDVLGL